MKPLTKFIVIIVVAVVSIGILFSVMGYNAAVNAKPAAKQATEQTRAAMIEQQKEEHGRPSEMPPPDMRDECSVYTEVCTPEIIQKRAAQKLQDWHETYTVFNATVMRTDMADNVFMAIIRVGNGDGPDLHKIACERGREGCGLLKNGDWVRVFVAPDSDQRRCVRVYRTGNPHWIVFDVSTSFGEFIYFPVGK